MNINQPAPKILQIPQEIRDAIYSDLFDLCQIGDDPKLIHPTYDPTTNPSQNVDSLFTLNYGYGGRLQISYHKTLPKYQLLPILQTCHQIRSEFQDFLHRTLNKSSKGDGSRGRGLRYELHLASYRLLAFPTWTALPLPPEEPYNLIEELWVNYEVREYGKRGGRFYACGGPGTEPYTLFHLLSNFLFHGPQGYYLPAINGLDPDKDGKRPRYSGGRCNPKVKHLILNISFEESSRKAGKFGELEANVESGKPGAQAVLAEAIQSFQDGKKDAAEWIERNVGDMAIHNYFDGYIEKLSIFFEGAELWKMSGWNEEEDGEYPLTHSFIVDRGFDRAHDWKESNDYVNYGFCWGPKPETRREFKLEQQSSDHS
ncbi:hypothetical protein TWF506_011183 [Arthrobotrys conoides]|uniref:Uncharacterized protein n=1 Tax=Arthrobotrys conoides TaxID=74498 RepID=A0AAN8RRW2_9PEZI